MKSGSSQDLVLEHTGVVCGNDGPAEHEGVSLSSGQGLENRIAGAEHASDAVASLNTKRPG